jgi:hypothetical protein
MDEMSTKRADAIDEAGTNRGGRPRIHPDRTMTPTERSARRRERRKQQRIREQFERKAAEAEKAPDAEVTPQEVLQSLIQSRGITSHFDRLLAVRAVAALVQGKLAEGVRALECLPPPRHLDDEGKPTTAGDAKARVLQMILNAIAADDEDRRLRIERGEASEADLLRARLAEVEGQLPAPDVPAAPSQPTDRERLLLEENAQLRSRLGEPPPPPSTERVRVIDGKRGDAIIPPSEIGNPNPMVGADDWKHQRKRNLPIIEGKAEPAAEPAPQPRTWDETEDAAKWREWRDRNPDAVGYL